MRRCLDEGNSFAPDLTDFLALVHSASNSELGIPFEDVKKEFKRYCRDRGYYDSAELFPWTNSNWLLYWICTSVRQKNPSDAEVDKVLRKEIREWATKLASGELVPTPATRIEDKQRTRPAWMDAYNKSKENAENSKPQG